MGHYPCSRRQEKLNLNDEAKEVLAVACQLHQHRLLI